MTWPAPTSQQPAPPAPAAPVPPAEQPPSEIRRLLRAVPPATWLALLGAALVLIAAGIVVAGSWSASGPAIRFAVITLATGGLTWTAEQLRPLAPTTAGVIAHVGAFLAAPAGIAGTSMLGATWPLCLLIGGALAIATTEFQGRRWQRSTLHAGQVGAIALAASGFAASTDTTAGLVGAVAAVGLMLCRAHRRAAGLAMVAVLSPLLWTLADAGIGAGTFERAGLVGARLGWSGPVVGVLAAVVLGITARRYRTNVLALAAAAAPVLGTVTGLAAAGAPNQVWWAVPALVVLAAETAWWLLPDDRQRTTIGRIVDVPAVGVTVGGLAAPLLVAAGAWIGDARGLAVPAFVTATAIAFAVMRWRPADRFVADLGVAAVASCLVAGAMALDSPAMLTAVLAIALVGAAAFLSRTVRPIAVYVPAWWAVIAIGATGGAAAITVATSLTLLAVLTALVTWLRARIAAGRGPLGWVEMSMVAPIAGFAAVDLAHWDGAATFLAATSLTMLLVVAFERRFHLWACAAGGAAGALATSQAVESVGLDPTLWIGWAVLTAVFAAIGTLARSTVANHLAAAAAVVTLAVAAGGVPMPSEQVLGFGMVAAVVLSGLAFTVGRRSPLDTAAAVAGALVGLCSGLDVDPMWVSGAWFVIGLQVAAYGLAAGQPLLQVGGSVVAAVAAVSAWFTSGADAWLVELVEPAGVTAGDLWMLVATLAAFAAGIAARGTLPVNSWLAYSGGLTIAGMWLTSVQVERDTVWAIPMALTIGMVAAAIGARHRLAALLIGGVALIATTLLVAIGRDLSDLPTWAWLAIGGLGLLGAAVLIERATEHGARGLQELADRWQ